MFRRVETLVLVDSAKLLFKAWYMLLIADFDSLRAGSTFGWQCRITLLADHVHSGRLVLVDLGSFLLRYQRDIGLSSLLLLLAWFTITFVDFVCSLG